MLSYAQDGRRRRKGEGICITREQRPAREKAVFIVPLMLYVFIVRQIDAQLIYVVTLARARALTEWITSGADMHRAHLSFTYAHVQ